MTESELARQFADVLERYGTPHLRPEEWTVQMFAASQKLTYGQAVTIVERALEARAVECVGLRQMDSHRIAKAYRYVSSPVPAA